MDFLANILNLKSQEPEQQYPMQRLPSPLADQPPADIPSEPPPAVKQILKKAGVTPQEAAQNLMSTINPQKQQAPEQMLNQRMRDYLDAQKAGIGSLEDQYKGIKNPGNLNPLVGILAAASDTLGSGQQKMLPQLLQNQAQLGSQYDDKKMKYLENIQKAKDAMSKEEIAYLGKQIADKKAEQTAANQDLKDKLILSSIARNNSVAELNRPGGTRQQMFDTNTHDKVVKRIGGDKILGQRVTQYQNLSNALNAVEQAGVAPVQQVHELQQAIRKNMGIGGTSGVSERSDTYINSIGMDKAKFMQYLTGNPQDILKSNPQLMHHLKEVAKIEMQNVADQKDKRLKVLTSGYDNALYNRRQDLKSDLDMAAEMAGQQFTDKTSDVIDGATKEWNGKTYKVINGHWEEQ